jgi:hypothetical protein
MVVAGASTGKGSAAARHFFSDEARLSNKINIYGAKNEAKRTQDEAKTNPFGPKTKPI